MNLSKNMSSLNKNALETPFKKPLTSLRKEIQVVTLLQLEKYLTVQEQKEKLSGAILQKILCRYAVKSNLTAVKFNHPAFCIPQNGYTGEIVIVKRNFFNVDPKWIFNTVNEGIAYDVLNDRGRNVILGKYIKLSSAEVKAPLLQKHL